MESRSCQTSPVATVKPTPRPSTGNPTHHPSTVKPAHHSNSATVREEMTTVTAVKSSDGREPQLEKLTPDGEQ